MSPRWRLAFPVALLVAIHLATLVGGFLAPNSAIEQNRDLAWSPPTQLRFIDDAGQLHLRPFVYPLQTHPADLDLYTEDRTSPCALRFLVRGDDYRFLGLFPTNLHFLGVDPPAKLYFLGTDGVGRDVFARTLVGGRTSLFAGLLAASLALTIGTVVGGIAGYFGGTTDAVLMRIVELFLALPWLYLLLAVRAFLPLSLAPAEAFLLLVLLIGFIGWAQPARIFRGLVLTSKNRLFVTAAHGFGSSTTRLFRKHILSQATGTLTTQAGILVPSYMTAEITLSFLGLGMPPPSPSWGSLLKELQSLSAYSFWWISSPALALLIVLVTYYFVQVPLQAFKSQNTAHQT